MNSLTVLSHEIQHQANPLVNVFNAVIDGVTQLAVNARDLHKFLKVGRDFTTWIKGRISQYVFVENVDYIIVENLSSPNRGSAKSRCQKMTDYHLTLDMAKELAMVENNEEGRKIRRYFIRCEKELFKTESQQRKVLVSACSKLAVGHMKISDVYLMVGKHFGYEGGIKGIPSSLLPEAVAFVYEMILRLREAKEQGLEKTGNINKVARLGMSKTHANYEIFKILEKALTDIEYANRELQKNNATHYSVFESVICQSL